MGNMSRGQELTLGDGLGLGTTLTLGDGGLTLESEATPIFSSIMTNTISPAISTGDSSPTFTRATTATVTDFEGLVKTVNSGEARFQGARRVENLCDSPQDFNSSDWAANADISETHGITDPDGGTTAVRLECIAGANELFRNTMSATIGEDLVNTLWVRSNNGTTSVNLLTPTSGSVLISITSEWQRFSTGVVTTVAAAKYAGVRLISIGDEVDIAFSQVELVSGQANQNPSEYVSVGAGVVDTNYAGQIQASDWTTFGGASVTDVGDGWFRIDRGTNTTPGDLNLQALFPALAVDGATVNVTYESYNSQAGVNTTVFIYGLDATYAVNTSTTSPVTRTKTGVSETGGDPVLVRISNQVVGNQFFIRFNQVGVLSYHGAGVDGVQYFSTENGNTVSSNVVTEATGPAINSSNRKYAVLPGANGDYFSTPDSVAASITGDIDLIARVDQPDWAAASARTVISKFSGGQAYQLSLYSATRINLLWRDAVGIKTRSSVSAPIVSGINWIRATLDVDNGAGGHTVNFYTSADSTTDPDAVVWVRVGVPLTTAGVTSILDDSGALQVGATSAGSLFTGTIYRAQIYNGIDGTLAVDFNPNNSDGTSPWTSDTGEEWTANGNTSIYVGEWDASGPKGYLSEGARENLILNSDVMVTQNITTTAAERTLSFYGTGTVTLSGTSTAGPLVGTGANDRVSLTYTPTAGTLTLTVSGTVTNAQDELGSFASSWIPTAGTAVTRNADQLSYATSGNFSDTAGTAYAEVEATDWANAAGQILGDGTEAPLIASSQKAGDLPGASGDYFSTPDSVDNSITSDITIAVYATAVNWGASPYDTLASKFVPGSFCYRFYIDNIGRPRLGISPDGSAIVEALATVIPTLVDGVGYWLRATWDDSADLCSFYMSSEPASTPVADIPWVQIGTSVSLVSAGIFDGGAAFEVGARGVGTVDIFEGTMKYCYLLPSVDPTTDPSVAFSVNDSDGTSPWNSSTTGEAWTANGNAAIIATDAALVKAYDGTNTAIGPRDTTNGIESIASTWNGGLIAYDNAVAGTPASYAGAFNLAQLNVGQTGFYGTIRNLKIWDRVITQEQLDSL